MAQTSVRWSRRWAEGLDEDRRRNVKKTLLLIAALSFSVHAEDHDRDDPIGRKRAQNMLDEGVRTAEFQKQILDAAASEAQRYGIGSGGRLTSAAVAGSAWVSIWSTTTKLAGQYTVPVGNCTGLAACYSATTVKDIAFDPGGQTVLAATDAGLFRSTQGGVGATWTLVDVESIAHTPQDCWSIAYAGTTAWVLTSVDLSNNTGHIWRSTDGGVTWGEVTNALGSASSDVGRITVASAAQTAGQPWRIYALASNKAQSDQKDVFRSPDGGASWASLAMMGCGSAACSGQAPTNPDDDQADLNFTHGQASYNQMLVVDPLSADTVFIGGNLTMARSTNGGTTWTVMTDWLPFPLTQTRGLRDRHSRHPAGHAATVAHVGGAAYFYGGNDGGFIRGGNTTGAGFLTHSPASVIWGDKIKPGT